MKYQKWIKILVTVLIVLGICAGGIGYALYNRYAALKENPMQAFTATSGEDTVIGRETEPAALEEFVTIDGKRYGKNPNVVTILMLGVDWDGSQERKDWGKRSDMIMLCTVDMQENTIDFHSIPRDTRTAVHDVDKKTGKIQEKTSLTKLCHAYALGALANDDAAAKNEMRAVEDLIACGGQLDIPVDYFVSIDLEHLPELADALNGVEVTLEQDMPEVGSKGQTVTLRGDTVRKYLQNRHDMQGGEMDRQRHEQDFMKAMAKTVKKLGAVNAAVKLFSQLSGSTVRTNLSLDQIAAMAGVLDRIGSIDDITMETFADKDANWPEKMHDPVLGKDVDYYLMDDAELLRVMLSLYYVPTEDMDKAG